MKSITITGARLHNLKEIDIAIPKNKLIVATGVSGSGKSSLVFDIIFEEGRRQYLQSLGVLSTIEDEDKFDSISGIGPAIAVQQSIIRQSNPRATVGSKTKLLSMLAVLYAGEGCISCHSCGTPVGDNLICGNCGAEEERLEASYFSYYSPNGMCLRCSGRGAYFEMDMNKLVPDERITLQGVLDIVGPTPGYMRLLQRKFPSYLEMPFSRMPDEVKSELLYGHHVSGNYAKRSASLTRIFEGRIKRKGEDLSGIYRMILCPECHGCRVGEEARRVFINDKHIGDIGEMTLAETQSFYENLLQQITVTSFGRKLLNEIADKTSHLLQMRLGHLSLYREMPTLSGGEIQRLFLHSHLNTKMDSLIYILDEPTIGLHESEKIDLMGSIADLKDLGNTVIVVEHDRNTIEMAEHIIDMGPKAGIEGGQVIYQGDLPGLLQCRESLTGQYLSGKIAIPARKKLLVKAAPNLTIRHARTNNLKDVTISIPLGALVGVAGVSGSGKSSLISDTLAPLLNRHFLNRGSAAVSHMSDSELVGENASLVVKIIAEKLQRIEQLSGYAEISQAPIGRNVNSNPATYTGIWDKIRKLFAQQPEAVQQGLSAGHFSFNSKGACPECGGSGREKIWLGGSFYLDKTCIECQGRRYNDQALSIRYKGKHIVDVLEMSISKAAAFFAENKGISATLKVMDRIGMGYIKLGQPTPTLSGGEAQRIKLAKEIGRKRRGHILYILDEPTTGLSLYDTAKLIHLLDELVAKGNSVIVIEHDPVVLSACDWLIELGPQGGADGGEIIAQGTTQELSNNPHSVTGKYLHL